MSGVWFIPEPGCVGMLYWFSVCNGVRLELGLSSLYHGFYGSPWNKAALWTETCPVAAGVETQFAVGSCTLCVCWGGGYRCDAKWWGRNDGKWDREEMLVGRSFLGYITVLFSRERIRTSKAGSTVIRAFDVDLNSSSYVRFISLSQPPIIFQPPDPFFCIWVEILMAMHSSPLPLCLVFLSYELHKMCFCYCLFSLFRWLFFFKQWFPFPSCTGWIISTAYVESLLMVDVNCFLCYSSKRKMEWITHTCICKGLT